MESKFSLRTGVSVLELTVRSFKLTMVYGCPGMRSMLVYAGCGMGVGTGCGAGWSRILWVVSRWAKRVGLLLVLGRVSWV